MLYIDKERKKDFKKERAILAEVFPFTFTKDGVVEKPLPIMIEYTIEPKKAAVYLQGNTEIQVGYRRIAAPKHKIAASGKFTEDGVTKEWILASAAPTISAGEKIFKKSMIEVSAGKIFDPIADFEKIVALYFYSSSFSNGGWAEKTGRGEGAMWKFVKQGEKAQERIKQETFRAKVYNMLLDPAGRLTDDQLNEVFRLMNFIGTGVMEDDRLSLYDSCLQRPEIAEKFFKNAKPVIESSKSVSITLGVQDLVKKAKKEKVLMIEGDKDNPYWVIKNENGVVVSKVCDAVGASQKDKDDNLVEYLKSEEKDIETLRELLKD